MKGEKGVKGEKMIKDDDCKCQIYEILFLKVLIKAVFSTDDTRIF